MQLPNKYNPGKTEEKWYQYWMDNKLFHSEPDGRKPYTIVIPPPNVTGILHMGHMLNNTLQDVLVRRARMRGFNACWVPGTDHASIATEAKVVAKLKKEGISKYDIGREKFLEHAWDWTHQYGGTILSQLKKLGCSCDWDRTRFTMDEDLSKSVVKVFVDLYNKGLIYRGYRMINWDPEAKTNISDEEVIYKEHQGKLYFLKYKIVGSAEFLTVATTRPETIFGDTAVCVNPNDERYRHLKGKKVIVPVVGREVPLIEDEYVDIEFGTGALKITPAHDENDYKIGQKYNLESIDSINDDGTLNHFAGKYEGKDRYVVRREIVKELKEKDLLLKEEDYTNKVGTSERTGAVIEPKISIQWFLKMTDLAKPALDVVLDGSIKFFPEKFINTYRHWMEEVHDWNISRQLWWGHRIPAFYYNEKGDFVVAETVEKALDLAKQKSGNHNLGIQDLHQDEDVLDTWFSSWLWPISVFNGINEPHNKDIEYYYPTSDLVTGPDIIFFWVARMVVSGMEYRKEIPFKNVYFTGIVRDKLRRKMSKSLGNSPDPIGLIGQYGADGVRVGLMLSSAAGNDLMFDESLMLQGRNFATKIWNAFKLTQNWRKENKPVDAVCKQAIQWFDAQLNKTISEINEQFEKFRISDALHLLYKLIWDDFCSWYLEAVKPEYGDAISKEVYDKTIEFFGNLMKLLHPFMPFITEEIWQTIGERKISEAMMVSQQPTAVAFDQEVIRRFDFAKDVISGIRNYRQSKGISPKESVELYLNLTESPDQDTIQKLANVSEFHFNEKTDLPSFTFLVGAVECVIPLSQNLNLEDEKNEVENELKYLEGFLKSVQKKLGNEKFMSGAPKAVVDNELKKQSDTLEKMALLQDRLASL